MEQELSILIADLSGYTALTETHGAFSAADLIDEYLHIVNDSLVGNSQLHQSVGDEVVIVSETPDHLLATAVMLLQTTVTRYNFLQVHGALHHGKIVRRKNNLFGPALNLTSRMAAQAKASTILCSDDFLHHLNDRSVYTFQSTGRHRFKNVSEEKELYEVMIDRPEKLHIDPVCRMIVNDDGNFHSHTDHPDVYFCSPDCLDMYLKNQALVKA